MEKETYVLIYWLKGQSKLFSEPQWYETDSIIDFGDAIANALENGYEIDYAGAI